MKFFASLVHNITAAGIGAAPTLLVAMQNPSGGLLAFLNAHPIASSLWAIATYGVTMAARDQLKNVPDFAGASGTVPPQKI